MGGMDMRTGVGKIGMMCAAAGLLLAVWPARVQAGAQEGWGAGGGRLTVAVMEDLAGQYPDLAEAEVAVDLYRVASTPGPGEFTALETLAAQAPVLAEGLAEAGPDTAAARWQELAEEAAGALGLTYHVEGDAGAGSPDEEASEEPAARLRFTGKEGGTAEGLPAGLYLVYAHMLETAEYRYVFTPYLVALPDNAYYTYGSPQWQEPEADGWSYDVSVGLKPERETLYGSLRIEKRLESYNATLGDAAFVFRVDVQKDGETVYSDVVSLSFDGPGTLGTVIRGLPVGAEATVSEVHMGPYRLVSVEPEGGTVTVQKDGAEGSPVTVTFVNEYDGGNRQGTSVVNHFERTDSGAGWKALEQLEDNREEE